MAAAYSAVVLPLMDELSDVSALVEANSSDDEEFLLLLMMISKERENHVRTDSYFDRTVPLYSLSDFESDLLMSRTTVTFLEGLLAACSDLPHEQKNGGRPTIELQKQVLITLWILGNPECLRSVADQFDKIECISRLSQFVERLPTIFSVSLSIFLPVNEQER